MERAGRQSLSVQAEMFACVHKSPWRAREAEVGRGETQGQAPGPPLNAPRCCTTQDPCSVSSLHSEQLCVLL